MTASGAAHMTVPSALMSDQPAPSDTRRHPKWAVEFVERLGIGEQVGEDWERSMRRDAARLRARVLCECGRRLAICGLLSPAAGDPERRLVGDDAELGRVQFFGSREPHLVGLPTRPWLISHVAWECKRCGFRRLTTRLALQQAVERAVTKRRPEVQLGFDL